MALEDNNLFETAALAVMTGGISLMTEPFMDEASQLKARRDENLKQAWALFEEKKSKLLPPHRNEVYHALRDARSNLNAAWGKYQERRREALDAHYAAKRKKHEDWRNSVKANLEKNQQRRANRERTLEGRHQRRSWSA